MATKERQEAPLLTGEWKVDALHSQVQIGVRHMAVAELRAKFPRLSGSLQVDAQDPLASPFRLEIEAAAVTTGHADQEDFIRSVDWLDAERHPLIVFTSTGISQTSADEYLARGDLTLRGVTRAIEVPMHFHGVVSDRWGLRTGFTSRFSLDRSDFGLTWNRVFAWGVMASPKLDVSLDIELVYPDEKLATPAIG